jgi:UDP-N-acetylglucosamine transferase subunit ALG13
MDRLVDWIDSLLDDGLADAAIIQAAAFRRRPRRASTVGVVGVGELDRLMRAADRIVTHGGPGSILQVLALGRRPIVVPRDPVYHEHVDDHQIRFARWLARRREIAVAEDAATLRAALREPDRISLPTAPGGAAVERVRALIEAP